MVANFRQEFEMRRLIIAVLLAGTFSVPVLAQDRDSPGRDRDRAGRSAATDEGERARPQRAERRAERVAERRTERVEQVQRSSEAPRQRSERAERAQVRRSEAAGEVRAPQRSTFERQLRDSAQIRQVRERRGERLVTERLIEARPTQSGTAVVVHRGETPTSVRSQTLSSSNAIQWSNHWRSDRRYDWRRHRHHHHSLFRLGNYWDPYGYRYRNFSIGFNLWPSYYRSQFWVDDPWQYRLPPTYGPYRWVRYYDDALLVNIYTGQVVDVERNFFW